MSTNSSHLSLDVDNSDSDQTDISDLTQNNANDFWGHTNALSLNDQSIPSFSFANVNNNNSAGQQNKSFTSTQNQFSQNFGLDLDTIKDLMLFENYSAIKKQLNRIKEQYPLTLGNIYQLHSEQDRRCLENNPMEELCSYAISINSFQVLQFLDSFNDQTFKGKWFHPSAFKLAVDLDDPTIIRYILETRFNYIKDATDPFSLDKLRQLKNGMHFQNAHYTLTHGSSSKRFTSKNKEIQEILDALYFFLEVCGASVKMDAKKAKECYTDIVQRFEKLNLELKMNIYNESGHSPLNLCFQNDNMPLATLLIENGATLRPLLCPFYSTLQRFRNKSLPMWFRDIAVKHWNLIYPGVRKWLLPGVICTGNLELSKKLYRSIPFTETGYQFPCLINVIRFRDRALVQWVIETLFKNKPANFLIKKVPYSNYSPFFEAVNACAVNVLKYFVEELHLNHEFFHDFGFDVYHKKAIFELLSSKTIGRFGCDSDTIYHFKNSKDPNDKSTTLRYLITAGFDFQIDIAQAASLLMNNSCDLPNCSCKTENAILENQKTIDILTAAVALNNMTSKKAFTSKTEGYVPVSELLSKGASLSQMAGLLPLQAALLNDSPEIFKELLECGASIDVHLTVNRNTFLPHFNSSEFNQNYTLNSIFELAQNSTPVKINFMLMIIQSLTKKMIDMRKKNQSCSNKDSKESSESTIHEMERKGTALSNQLQDYVQRTAMCISKMNQLFDALYSKQGTYYLTLGDYLKELGLNNEAFRYYTLASRTSEGGKDAKTEIAHLLFTQRAVFEGIDLKILDEEQYLQKPASTVKNETHLVTELLLKEGSFEKSKDMLGAIYQFQLNSHSHLIASSTDHSASALPQSVEQSHALKTEGDFMLDVIKKLKVVTTQSDANNARISIQQAELKKAMEALNAKEKELESAQSYKLKLQGQIEALTEVHDAIMMPLSEKYNANSNSIAAQNKDSDSQKHKRKVTVAFPDIDSSTDDSSHNQNQHSHKRPRN